MVLWRSLIESPVGPMLALASEEALCALEFSTTARLPRLRTRLARWFGNPDVRDGANAVIVRTEHWLDEYFSGQSADISSLTLDMRGAPFELQVWEALRRIPAGTTTSYGSIARELGTPGAARAVGMANGANPIAIIVPCHRVIGANGTLTGYGGGLPKKTWLLQHEQRWAQPPETNRAQLPLFS